MPLQEVNITEAQIVDEIGQALGLQNIFFLFGSEIEFYALSDITLTLQSPEIKAFYKELQDFCDTNNIVVENLDKEDGLNQFEIQMQPNDWSGELADHITAVKQQISRLLPVDFAAKPFADRPGSGVHFHISMYSQDERNLFMKKNKDDDRYADLLYYAIGGLMQNMPQDMPFFAPTPNCYLRYQKPQNSKHIQYPTNYSWGVNNRTCAIRIPQSPVILPQDTRIEHRVCSPVSDPKNSLRAILLAIRDGIIGKIPSPEPVFGNAFDAQYDNIESIVALTK